MSDLLLSHMFWSERLDFSELQQRRSWDFPFLLTSLGAHLHIKNTAVLKYPIKIVPPYTVEIKIGSILAIDTQQNLLNHQKIRFCSNLSAFPLHTQWIQVNWWILSHDTYIPNPPFSNVSTPPEVICTSYVQLIPLLYLYNLAFIFNIEEILHGSMSYSLFEKLHSYVDCFEILKLTKI